MTTFIILLMLTFFLSIPIISTGSSLPFSSDWPFHIHRLEGLTLSLNSGAYPVGIYSSYFNGFGYGVPLFYPDFFILPFAIIRLLGVNPSITLKLIIIAIIFTTALTTYLSAKGMTGSSYVGNFVMIGYSMCQYHLVSIYHGGSLGILMAMIFVPLLIWGTYNLTEQKFSKPLVLILAFTGLLLSHILSTFLSLIFVSTWCIFRINKIATSRRIIIKLLISAFLCISLTAFFWMPFLEQLLAQDLSYQNVIMSMQDFVPLPSYLMLPRHHESYGLAIFVFFLLVPAAFLWSLYKDGYSSKHKKILCYYTITLFFIILITSKQVWKFAAFYSPVEIQFPSRLGSFSFFFLFFVLALTFRYFKNLKPYGLPLVAFLGASTCCFLSSNIKYKSVDFESFLSSSEFNTFSEQAGYGREWIPKRTSLKEIHEHPHQQYLLPDFKTKTGQYLQSGGFTFNYDEKAGTYEVPLLWYKGYQSKLTAINGQNYDLETDSSRRAFVTISIPPNLPKGTITTKYHITCIHQIGIAISVSSLFIIFLFYAYQKISFKKHKKKLIES